MQITNNTNTQNLTHNFYNVTAKCGHVGGSDFYIPISFPVKAGSAAEAAAITRNIPRVKHDQKYAIISVHKITQETYDDLIIRNQSDPYLLAQNKQEQEKFAEFINLRICEENKINPFKNTESVSKRDMYIGKQRIRKPNRCKYMFYDDIS